MLSRFVGVRGAEARVAWPESAEGQSPERSEGSP